MRHTIALSAASMRLPLTGLFSRLVTPGEAIDRTYSMQHAKIHDCEFIDAGGRWERAHTAVAAISPHQNDFRVQLRTGGLIEMRPCRRCARSD